MTTFAELMTRADVENVKTHLMLPMPDCQVQTVFLKDFTKESQLTEKLMFDFLPQCMQSSHNKHIKRVLSQCLFRNDRELILHMRRGVNALALYICCTMGWQGVSPIIFISIISIILSLLIWVLAGF